MDSKEKEKGCCVFCASVALFVVLALLSWWWYKAGVQSDVYQRQGIHMTQWETFIGTKPAQIVKGD